MLHLRKAFYNMSKILITGNGFDLFHHLPTKYHHFISIMQTIEKNNYDNMVSFEKLFGDVFKDRFLTDFNSIVENYKVEDIKFDFNKINELNELLSVNLWYKYFKTVLEIDTWIDFEMEIDNILNQLVFFNKFNNKWAIKSNGFFDELIVFNDFELFKIVQIINLQGGFRLNEKYINKRKNTIDIKKMLSDLAKSFEDFIVIFNRYLVDVVSVFYTEIKQKLVIPFHLMDEIYTFNYTPTLENIYKVQKSKIVYLHGEINEDCSKQNLVLGISEMSKDIKTHKMFDFTKYYQKVRKRTNRNFIELPAANKAAFDETLFYVIGHSLDNSDKEYIEDLFRFLELDSTDMSKIFVFYFNSNDYDSKLKNLLSIIEKPVILDMNKNGRLNFIKLNVENVTEEFNKEITKRNVFF
jgi:hypothetical protein